MGRARREDLQRRFFLSLDDVDWNRSRVYSMGNFGQLFVNLKGREPQGIVSPGSEYDDLMDEITQRLKNLVDPETGQPVIERIFRREEIYEGTYADRAPDLMFFTQNMEYKAMGLSDFSSPKVFEPIYGTTGHHRMNGLLICHGEGVFMEGEELEDARIQDLAPTILYLMGQPITRGRS
jgi:predicted AlkP superfamily phosphohydrolase/phosphomutase